MVVVRTEDLLRCWEHGARHPGFERGLALLELVEAQAIDLPIGARERRLLDLRRALFGDTFDAVATCPSCRAVLELQIPVAQLLSAPPAGGPHTLELDGRVIRFRLPTSRDVLAVLAASGGDSDLLARCVESVAPAGPLPEAARAALEARMAELDPGAEIALRLDCMACGAGCRFLLDAGDVLFREVDRWARATFREIHALARAYGWTEREILALTPERRRTYLALVEGAA